MPNEAEIHRVFRLLPGKTMGIGQLNLTRTMIVFATDDEDDDDDDDDDDDEISYLIRPN